MRNHIFAICLNNEDFEVSLERRKLYEIIPDLDAEQMELIKVIDESGEAYLYPKDFFAIIPLPAIIEKQIIHAA
jgi:hypothetical protein